MAFMTKDSHKKMTTKRGYLFLDTCFLKILSLFTTTQKGSGWNNSEQKNAFTNQGLTNARKREAPAITEMQ